MCVCVCVCVCVSVALIAIDWLLRCIHPDPDPDPDEVCEMNRVSRVSLTHSYCFTFHINTAKERGYSAFMFLSISCLSVG